MKKLSDYKGDEAIELWADLIPYISTILTDETVRKMISDKKSKMDIARKLLKTHKEEVVNVLQRIDPEPLDGLNLILKLVAVLSDIGSRPEIQSFFGYAEQAKTESESIGSVTENIEVVEK